MFKVNDTVLYGAEGVCRIDELTEKDFRGKRVKYYVLKPIYKTNSILDDPMENEELVGRMRTVPTQEEIRDILQKASQDESIWIEDEAERKVRYREILASGSSREIMQLIRTLYVHQKEQKAKGKKLHMAEERLLKEAEKLLCDEFALVLGMQQDQAISYIWDRLGKTDSESRNQAAEG